MDIQADTLGMNKCENGSLNINYQTYLISMLLILGV